LIDDTATTKEVVITGFQLWQSQRFNRHNAYAREVLFWQDFSFLFRPICFCTTRLGSGRLGAREGSNKRLYVQEDTARPCIEMVPYIVAQSLKFAGTT